MAEKGLVNEKVGWWQRLKKELTPQRNLIYLKLILSMQNFGLAFVLPFVTLHMRQLGITYSELAAIFTFTPITAILGPPIAGMVADKTGRYKSVIFFNVVSLAMMTVLLLYVPARPTRALTLTCDSEGHNLTWSYCDLCQDDRNDTLQEFTLQDCEFTCSDPPPVMKMCFDTGQQQSCFDINTNTKVGLNGTIMSSRDDQTCNQSFTEVTYQGQLYRDLACPPSDLCPVTCQVTSPPPCHDPRDPSNSPRTFWIYMVVRLLWNLFGISSATMTNAITLTILKERGGELGKQRVLPVIAYSIAPFISGAIVDWHSTNLGYSDYTPAFYIAGFVLLLNALMMTRLDFTPERSQQRLLKDLKKLVTKVDVDAFIILVFLLGINWGFLETFLFVHLKSLGAPNSLMGASILVSNIFAIPVIFLCDKIIDKVGYNTVFIFSFFVYAFREFTYSLFGNPVAIVCLESVKVLAYNFPWNAMVRLCPDLAPKGLLATMSGIVFSVHHTFGWSAGSVLGGTMVNSLGLPNTFRAFSYVSLTCGAGYLILYVCYIRRRRSGDKEEDVEERNPMMLTEDADTNSKQADNNDIKPSDNTGEDMDVTRPTYNTSKPADNLNNTVTTSDNNGEAMDFNRPTDNTPIKPADNLNNTVTTSDNNGEAMDVFRRTDNTSTTADNIAKLIDNTDSEIPDTKSTGPFITTENDINTTPTDISNTTDNIKTTDNTPINPDTTNTHTNNINTTDNNITSTDTTAKTPDSINTPTDTTNTNNNNNTISTNTAINTTTPTSDTINTSDNHATTSTNTTTNTTDSNTTPTDNDT